LFTVGGRGEHFAQRLFALPDIAFVQIADFFGLALRHAATAGAGRVTMASMIGKLAKFAAGNESVHSRESTQDFTLLSALARRAGAEEELIQQVQGANTAQEVSELMSAAGLPTFHDLVCQAAWTYAMSLTHKAYPLEILLLGRAGQVLGRYPQRPLPLGEGGG
jgi:cobalt-precorrin-5B (C1)-methyltransferase